ncbi:MAG: hypothetical protein ABSA33_00175 [Candidatus Micrarchaeaceae archaeon]
MSNLDQKARYRSVQNFAILAVSMGVLLVLVGMVSGASILVAFYKGIIVHTLTDVRNNVIRLVFSFAVPLVGGIVLVFAGIRLLRIDNTMKHREVIARTRIGFRKEKDRMLRVLLGEDERRIMELVKGRPDGVLQSDLVIKTGYSKVKMHRILKSLENKGLVKRGRFGITNKVIINS